MVEMTKRQKRFELSGDVLKNLRESSGYTIEEIARKLKTTEAKIESAEKGKASFTLTQIKKLAKIYNRPIASFFSSSIQKLPQSPDYRINREKRLTPNVYLAQRRAYYLSEKIKEISGKKTQFFLFSRELKADELAKRFRETLEIELIKNKKPDTILATYKEFLEFKLNVLIIEFPLKSNDVRALSIFSDISSIVLNENDKPSIKLFSLFHEICHLIRKTGGICSLEEEVQEQSEERYCNSFAAEFLVPKEDLKNEVKNYDLSVDKAIDQLSDVYGVSKQVMMIRLLENGYINKETYEKFKRGINEEEIKKEGKQFGRRNWDKVFLNRVGRLSLEEVRNAYLKENITFYEASSILNLKTKYAERLIT